jgi:hypothetical protein
MLAHAGGRCVGYHGLLPGLLAGRAGRSKLLWLITFYVDPAWRSRGVGRALVHAIMERGADLATTGITAGAEGVYRASGFRDLGELAYLQWRGAGLPRGALAVLHAAARLAAGPRAGGRRRKGPFGEGPPRLAAGAPHAPRFHRGRETADWMLSRPWVVSAADARPDVDGYHFSRVRERFAFIPMQAPGGDFLLSASRHRGRAQVKVLDLFFERPEGAAAVLPAALAAAQRFAADRIDFPAGLPRLPALPAWYRRRIKARRRLTLYRPARPDSPLAAAAAGELLLDYCDGDTAFT